MEEPLSVQILDRLDSLNNADPAVHVFSVFTGIINFIRELKPTERAAALVYAVNNFGHRKPGVRTAAGEYPQLTIDNPDEADSHRLLADFADLRQWLSAEERQPLVVAARVWEIIQKQKYPERLTCVLLEL
ncbi:MAG: hypothetical protein HW383_215 [Candidatus Magasanikbacteria bacterium]|nr:hypothetical protein [Candidatus Magasanikbacteria bacterium]